MTRRRPAVALLPAMALAASLGACDLQRQQALRALDSADPAVRAQALKVVAERRIERARPRVRELLRDRSARVRRAAVAAIGVIGPGEVGGIHAVIERLHDGDLQVRLAAVRVLGDAAGKQAARRALLPMLRDRSMVVRRAAALALEALGLDRRAQLGRVGAQLVDEQIAALASARGGPAPRIAAATALGRGGWPRALPALVAALEAREPDLTRASARAIATVGGSGAVAALVALGPRRVAAEGLCHLLACRPPAKGRLAPKPDGCALPPVELARARLALERSLAGLAAPERRALWRDLAAAGLDRGSVACGVVAAPVCEGLVEPEPDGGLDAAAVAAACRLGCQAQASALAGWLADPRGEAARRARAYATLVRLAGDHDRALLAYLRAEHARYRTGSQRWLGRRAWARVAGASSWPAATGVAKPPPVRQRKRALRWLLNRFPERDPGAGRDPLMPPAVDRGRLAAMVRALTGRPAARAWLAALAGQPEEHAGLRAAALDALAGADGADPSTARVVARSLGDRQALVRRAALGVCEVAGTSSKSQALAALADRDFAIRAAAARCLGRLGDAAAVPPLIGLLRREPQLAAIEALGALGDHRATPHLLGLLREDHAVTRYGERLAVIEALGALGDRAAAPALERELDHPDWRVRAAAARALARAGRATSGAALALRRDLDPVLAVRRACGSASTNGRSRR